MQKPPSSPGRQTVPLVWLIIATTLTKVLLNTTRRLIYPFAPEFARGLGVGLPAVTAIIALNQTTSILGPVTASFGDKYGYKPLMLIALALVCIGLFAAGIWPVYAMILFCFFLAGLAKSIFDPTLQAFVGKNVAYANRGKIIGITEFSWAGSTLVGIPLCGIVISRFEWYTPFFLLGALCLASFVILLKLLPNDHKKNGNTAERRDIVTGWKQIVKSRHVVAMLFFVFLMSMANDNLFVIYGAWLESSFQLSLAAIGFGTIIIGASEVAGEFFTAFFSDRIGLKKSIVIGLAACAASYFALPLLNSSLAMVMSGLFLVFFTFEFTIVTSMSLSTELVPAYRAATMSAFFAIAGLGRVAGAFMGGLLWSRAGLEAISMFSGTCTLLALAAILVGFSRSERF
jgi:predicted MFS family arabinose efflux permease